MSVFNKEAFEAALEITAAAVEGGAALTLDKRGAESVMEFFSGVYERMSILVPSSDDDEDEENEEDEDEEPEGEAAVKNHKFEIFTDKSGKYRFRMKSANGRVIATSQGYKKKDSCFKGVKSVISGTAKATVTEITE